MRGGWSRAAALGAGLFLFASACTPIIGQNSKQTGNVQASPSTQTSPSSAASPSSSTGGNTESPPGTTPSASPSSSPSTAPARLIITSFSLHVGEAGIAYAPVTVGASGGTPPYKWSVGSGTLPGGLTFSTGGKLSGTPTAAGGFSFVIQVDDSAGQAAGVQRSLSVARPLTATGLYANICAVEAGCIICGAYGASSGGVGPLQYKVTFGAPPTGMTINSLSLVGPFPPPPPPPPPNITVGPPPPPYDFAFTTTITDALGGTANVAAYYVTYPHIALTGGSCGPSYGCQIQLPYTLGTPNITPKLTITNVICGDPPCTGTGLEPGVNTLPNGFSAQIANGIVTITFGSPGVDGDWVGSIDVTITDNNSCGPGQTLCSATVTVPVDSEAKFG